MEYSMKVIVFLIRDFYSESFSIISTETEDESKWRIGCELNEKIGSTDSAGVVVYLKYESGRIPWKVVFSPTIVKEKADCIENLRFQYLKQFACEETWKTKQEVHHARDNSCIVSQDYHYNNSICNSFQYYQIFKFIRMLIRTH
jgi:hypothetical protein